MQGLVLELLFLPTSHSATFPVATRSKAPYRSRGPKRRLESLRWRGLLRTVARRHAGAARPAGV